MTNKEFDYEYKNNYFCIYRNLECVIIGTHPFKNGIVVYNEMIGYKLAFISELSKIDNLNK